MARDAIPSWKTLTWLCLFLFKLSFSTVIWQGATALEILQQEKDAPCLSNDAGCQACIKPPMLCPGELNHVQSFHQYLQSGSQHGLYAWHFQVKERTAKCTLPRSSMITGHACALVHICAWCLQQAALTQLTNFSLCVQGMFKNLKAKVSRFSIYTYHLKPREFHSI